MELVKINMLGGFAVSVGNTEICGPDTRRGQLWNLLQYLVTFRHREIPAEELQNALWPNGTGNPANALKNLVYRVRTTFENAGIEDAKRLILCKRGIYRLNERIELWVDAEEFAAAAQLASTAQGAERQAALQRAARLYAGDYLSGEIRQAWVTPVREKLHSQYALCALPLMEQADEATDWEPLLALSGHSIEIDPFDGDAAYYRLRALLGLDQQPKALEYYNQLQNLYYRERGEKLPERVRGLYFDIIRHMNNIEIDIAKIKQDISEKDAIAEGIERTEDFFGCPCWRDYSEPEGPDASVCPDDPIGSFRTLWESTGGDWDANPWVWAIDFKVLSTTGRPA